MPENKIFRTKTPLPLLMSVFIAKSHHFLSKKEPLLTAIIWEPFRALVLFFVSVRWKITVTKNVSFRNYSFEIWLLDCTKLTKNWKNNNDATTWRHNLTNIFLRCCVLSVKFSYWSKFHVNVITGSRVMTIFIDKDSQEIQKLEIPLSEFCPISGNLDKLGILSWQKSLY